MHVDDVGVEILDDRKAVREVVVLVNESAPALHNACNGRERLAALEAVVRDTSIFERREWSRSNGCNSQFEVRSPTQFRHKSVEPAAGVDLR